jgi:Zn-finger nucleic acid-binding protein
MEPAPPASCPRCRKVPLDDQPLVRHCARCHGSWIAEATLHERVVAARPGRGLTWRKEARAALMCAICAEPMETLVVRNTPVDRCPAHGIWFDAHELAHVLTPLAVIPAVAAAGPAPDSVIPDLVEGGLEIAVELAVETASPVAELAVETAAPGVELAGDAAGVVVETGGGVFEVVIGGVGFVAEAVVDALAGIFSSLD